MENIHPHDIGTIMDSHGVAIRAGNHCTQPVMDFYSIPATARASFVIYNDKTDVDKLISSVKKTMGGLRMNNLDELYQGSSRSQ